MRWSVALFLATIVSVGLTGCRSSCAHVENELRAREDDVRQLRENLDRSEFHNQLLMRELLALRGEPGPGGVVCAPSTPYPLKSIRLGRQTGGKPSDDHPWHQALQVMLEPIDAEGHALKAPGTLFVEVQEVSEEGLKRNLSAWKISPEELRSKWQSGLFTTGYLVSLPWRAWPSREKLRVIARFQLIDGRIFEADKDVTIRVAPEKIRKTLPVPPVTPTYPETVLPGPTPGIPNPTPKVPEYPPPPPTPPGGDSEPPPPVPPPTEEKKTTPKSDTLPAPKIEKNPEAKEGPELIRAKGTTGGIRVQMFRPILYPKDD